MGEKSAFITRIFEGFYRGYDSGIMKINRVQQVHGIDVDLFFLKEMDWGRGSE